MKKYTYPLAIIFIFFSHVSFAQITSVQSGSWDNTSTWSCGCVPTQNSTVTVSAGHTVTMATNNSKARFLTVDGTLKFPTSPAVYLLIYRKLTISATGSITGNIYLRILRAGSQPSKVYNNSAATVSIIDFRAENIYGVQFKTGNFIINRQLLVSLGTLTVEAAANVTLNSTSSSTSRIDPVGGNIVGNFTVRRYISTRAAAWADLASPVTNSSFSDWDSELYMSGVGGLDSNSCYDINCDSIFYSVYTWNNSSQSYNTITDTSTALPHSLGVELWLASDQTNFNAGFFDTRGSVYTGNLTLSGAQLASGAGEYNFLGNPYHSWIKWNNVTKNNLKNEVWIYDAATQAYKLYSGLNIIIPASQGFWVENSGINPDVTFTESAKYIYASPTFYRLNKDEDEEIYPEPMVTDEEIVSQIDYLANETEVAIYEPLSGLKNQTYLRPHQDALSQYDINDAGMLPTKNKNISEIYTHSTDGKKLSLNSFNNNEDIIEIPLSIKTKNSQQYSIEFNNLELIKNYYPYVYLIDNKSNEIFSIDYSNSIYKNFKENELNNFILRLSKKQHTQKVDNLGEVNMFITTSGVLRIALNETHENVSVKIYSVLGQSLTPLLSYNNTNQIDIQIPYTKGIVLVETTIDGKTQIQKLSISY